MEQSTFISKRQLLRQLFPSCTRVRNGGAPLIPPRYLHLDLPKHVIRKVSRFRLRAHTLAVESSIWRAGNGHCDKCSCAAVQNEVHVLFHCQDLLCALSEESARSFSSLSRGYKGLQEKGLQSRSANASLLIKNYQCMQEEI